MYFAVSFHFQSFVFIAILLAAVSHALPLESRAGQKSVKLQDGLGCKKGRGPCICRNSNGPEVRLSSPLLLKQCGSFAFQSVAENGHILVGLEKINPIHPETTEEFACDHESIVQLEFVALQINKSPLVAELCASLKADKVKRRKLVQLLNGGPNVMPVPIGVRNKKALDFNNRVDQVNTQTLEAYAGYLEMLSRNTGYPGFNVANNIQELLGPQFQGNLQAEYRAQIEGLLTKVKGILEDPVFIVYTDPFTAFARPTTVSNARRSQPATGIVNSTHNVTEISLPSVPIMVIDDGKPVLPPIPPLDPNLLNATLIDTPANGTSSIPPVKGFPAKASNSSAPVKSSGAAAAKAAAIQTATSHSSRLSQPGRPTAKPVATP